MPESRGDRSAGRSLLPTERTCRARPRTGRAEAGAASHTHRRHRKRTCLIDLGMAADPAALERARREVDLLKSINHPNVVAVSSTSKCSATRPWQCSGSREPSTGTDLRYGGSGWLSTLLSSTRRGSRPSVRCTRRRVIHRDLSPGNVQRLASGKFVVMDPGFAKHTLRSGLTVGGQPGTRAHDAGAPPGVLRFAHGRV